MLKSQSAIIHTSSPRKRQQPHVESHDVISPVINSNDHHDRLVSNHFDIDDFDSFASTNMPLV
jgi:hypothetical protein